MSRRGVKVEVDESEDKIHYLKMIQFIEENVDSGTINNPDVYDYINTLMDIDNFINYFASQIFFLNPDWPGNNISLSLIHI